MSKLQLILNGDDLGRAACINTAIVQAHIEGMLTSASLMVAEEAADDAVAKARTCPSLAVGLHLVILDGKPAAPAGQIAHLLDRDGRFPRDPFRVGVRCFFSPVVRTELRREFLAQFELFRSTGLPLAHVDGHFLMHLHPTVFSILIPLAEEYGAPGMRLPRDDLGLALSLDSSRAAGKAVWAAVYAVLCRLALRRLRRSSLAYTDRVYGFLQTGRMHEGFVAGLVERIPPVVRSAELYFHPSTEPMGEPFGPNPGDLAALLSPRVRQAIREREAQLTTYAALGSAGLGREPCRGRSSS